MLAELLRAARAQAAIDDAANAGDDRPHGEVRRASVAPSARSKLCRNISSKAAAARSRGSTAAGPRLSDSTTTSEAAADSSATISAKRAIAAASRSRSPASERKATPTRAVTSSTIVSKVAKKQASLDSKYS